MHDWERWKPSEELINRAENAVARINALLAQGRFREADALSNECHQTIGNGLGLQYLDELWEGIRASSRLRAAEVEKAIGQGELDRANEIISNSSFLHHDQNHLLHLYALKLSELRPEDYNWRDDPDVQHGLEMAQLTPMQADRFYQLLEGGHLRPHKFLTSGWNSNVLERMNLFVELADCFKKGTIGSYLD